MSIERVLVVALALTSTMAAGLAADARAPARLGGWRMVALVAGNVVALPLLTYLVTRVAAVDGAGGLVLAAAAPGGSTGPLLAILSRGEAATAARAFVALTIAGMVAALIATAALDVAGLGAVALATVVVAVSSLGPLLAGLAVRARRPAEAVRWQPWLSRLSLALLLATIAALTVRHHDAARPGPLLVGAVLTVAALALGRLAPAGGARVATAQVSAVRNLTLVLLVLTVVRAPAADTMAALAAGLAMYVVALVAALVWRSGMKRS